MQLYRVLVLISCTISLAFGIILDRRSSNSSLLNCYDFIVVGGGISGLIVANRLAEDPQVTVLIVDASNLNQNDDTSSNLNGQQRFLMNQSLESRNKRESYRKSAHNPIDSPVQDSSDQAYWIRGASADFDAWTALGNPGWNWEDLVPYFTKVEKYTDYLDHELDRKSLDRRVSTTYGTDGYVDISFPDQSSGLSQTFLDGFHELNVPIFPSLNDGYAAGGFLLPSSPSPQVQSRTFLQGIERRSNLHILMGQRVNRVLVDLPSTLVARDFPTGLWVYGVEFAIEGDVQIQNITCSREVIITAGAIDTPQILELSGIGPADLVEKFDITSILDLPGVGNNLQIPPSISVPYSILDSDQTAKCSLSTSRTPTRSLLNQTRQQYSNETEQHTSCVVNAVAFLSLQSTLINGTVVDFRRQDPTTRLLSGLDSSVVTGYLAQKRLLTDLLNDQTSGDTEVLGDNFGNFQLSAIHTLSRGFVHINSLDPFTPPEMDPRFCSDPIDCQLLLEAIQFSHQVLNTTAMADWKLQPLSPLSEMSTLEAVLESVLAGINPESRVIGTTAMLPRELGGVVDTHLRVWGTKNLRIVGAGIFPLTPTAHLEAVVCAVAERAADLIKLDNYAITPDGCGLNSSFARSGPVLSFTSYEPSAKILPAVNSPSEVTDGQSIPDDSLIPELRRREHSGHFDHRRYMIFNTTSASDELTTTLITDITITSTTTVPRSPTSLSLTQSSRTTISLVEPIRFSAVTTILSPNSTSFALTTTLEAASATSLSIPSTASFNFTPSAISSADPTATTTNSVNSTSITNNTNVTATADPTGIISATNINSILAIATQPGNTSQLVGSIGTTGMLTVADPISKNNYTFTLRMPTTVAESMPSITSSDDLTTTIVQDITITRTTTVPRSGFTMTGGFSIPSGMTTWVIPRPLQITPSSLSTASDAAVSQAASWLDTIISSNNPTITKLASQPTIMDVSTSAGDPVQSSTSRLPYQSLELPSFKNPGYYGYYGFSRIAIPEPTSVVSTSIVTSYVTATIFTTLPGRCKD